MYVCIVHFKSSHHINFNMAASKDGIESVHVKLAQIPPFYRAGEDLTGKVIVVCDTTTPIKAVKVY